MGKANLSHAFNCRLHSVVINMSTFFDLKTSCEKFHTAGIVF